MWFSGSARGGGLKRPASSSVPFRVCKEVIACAKNSSDAIGFSVEITFEISFRSPKYCSPRSFNHPIGNNCRENSFGDYN